VKTPPPPLLLPVPALRERDHLTIEEFLVLLYSPSTPKIRDLAPRRSRTRSGRGIVVRL
jgi:hypothetical protein